MRSQTIKGGFSIIELIIYAALLVMFLAILSNLFLTSIDIKTASEGQSYLGQDSRAIIARMNYDFLRATTVTAPALGATGNSLSLTINGATTTYTLMNGKIKMSDATGTYDLNGSETNVTALSFETLDGLTGKRSVQMNFTISGQSYSTTFGTR